MKRFPLLLLLIISTSIIIAACSAFNQSTISITDDLEREIDLQEPAQRIVSLAASNTEILFAIGAGEQVIGRDNSSNFPLEVLELPSVGGFEGYSLELITSLQPDLVLAAEINSPELVHSIEELGITVFYLANPDDLEGLFENLEIVATLTGHEQEAETLIQSLQDRIEDVEKRLENATSTPKVFYELDASDPTKPWSVGAGTYHDTLIRMAAAENIAAGIEGLYPQISLEELIIQNPDYILLADAMWGITPEQVAARPGWEDIKAVKEGNIVPFDGNLLDRPGPRLVDGLEELVRILHPELDIE